MISKNIALGYRIIDVAEIKRLAGERKSVIWKRTDGTYRVLSASFVLGWQLNVVLNSVFHYSIKVNSNETKNPS